MSGRSKKPDGYPLPWCDALGMPYWQVNFQLCAQRPGWRDWQRGKDMQEIIPRIDQLIGGVSVRLSAAANLTASEAEG